MREYHLWRSYRAAPFWRWACSVVEAPDTTQGFRIVGHDGDVADAAFLHALREHLDQPADGMVHVAEDWGHADAVHTFQPGEPEHFDVAIRQFRMAKIGPEGVAA